MRPRLLLPATLAAAALAATALALPATSAYADGSQPTATATATASPTDPPTDAPTAPATPPPTDTTPPTSPTSPTSPTDSASPTDTPTPSPTASAPVVLGSPKPGLPWATSSQITYNQQDQGIFSVSGYDYAGSTNQSITSVTVTLTPVNVLPGGDSAPVTFPLTDDTGYPYDQYYSPITLPSLGSYSVSVELTDSSDNDVVVNTGQVTYHEVVAFSVTADGPASNELTYDDRTISTSGVLTATDPRTGQQSPVAGVPVSVYYGYGTGSPNPLMGNETTAADGSFTVPPYTANGAGYVTATYTPAAADSLLYGSADVSQLAQQYFQTQSDQLRVQLTSPTNVDVPAGGSATVTGTVQVLDGGVWKPAPGAEVELDRDAYTTLAPVKGVTDSQGHISLKESVPGPYTLDAESSAFYDYADALTSVTVHIPQPTTFRSISIGEDEYGEATVQGVLKPGDGSQFLASGSWIEAQYSSNDKSWYNVGRCSVTSNQVGCYGTYAGKANGYWRVAYPGSVDWQPVTSKAFYLSRDYTWISGGRPSSSHPGRNQREYFSGTLHQYYSGKWHDFPKAKVRLLFRPTGTSTWYLMATATTNGIGNYGINAQDPEGGTWVVVYIYADSAHLDTQGPTTWIGVH